MCWGCALVELAEARVQQGTVRKCACATFMPQNKLNKIIMVKLFARATLNTAQLQLISFNYNVYVAGNGPNPFLPSMPVNCPTKCDFIDFR